MSLGMKTHTIHHALGKVDSIYSYDPIRLEVKGKYSVPIGNFLLLCEITVTSMFMVIFVWTGTVLMVHIVQHI